MEKVTGVPGEHMTREKTLDGVEEIIGKAEGSIDEQPDDNASQSTKVTVESGESADTSEAEKKSEQEEKDD